MNTVTPPPVEPVKPDALMEPARPLLELDTTTLRLSSPRGDAAHAALTITNNGDVTLRGTATARVGETWLRVTPPTLEIPPHESLQLAVTTETADLPTGYLRGEIAVTSNGGAATVAVRFGVRAGRVWRVFAIAVAAVVIATLLVGVALARVNVVAPPLSLPPLPSLPAGSHGVRLPPIPGIHSRGPTLSPAAHAAALTDIQQSVKTSNSVWVSALTLPSPSALASVESGDDLRTTTAEVNGLVAAGERWRIAQSAFTIQPHSVTVSDDGATGAVTVVKTERRALYGTHAGTPYDDLNATYRLRYDLVRPNGRWLVDRVTVESVTPHTDARTLASVQDVYARVAPIVMRVEADSTGQTAVGTGIVVRSSATGSDILTNDHVVTGAGGNVNVEHRTDSGTDGPWRASRVSEDPADDLAVIHIDHGNLPVAAWGDPATLQLAQQVVAIGYAEDLPGGPTVTPGDVSSLARPVFNGSSDNTYIQHSATINHGNSGGPLVDMSGRVVGVNTLSLDNTQGLFFAIPFTRAAPIIANDTGSNG